MDSSSQRAMAGSEIEYSIGGGKSNNSGEASSLKDSDAFLPVTNIVRIMRRVIPEHAKITKDAKEMIQECVSEFVSFITSEASEKCATEKRRTLSGEDVLWAIATHGFWLYVEPLKVYLRRYRDWEDEKNATVISSNSNKSTKRGSRNRKKSTRQGDENELSMMSAGDLELDKLLYGEKSDMYAATGRPDNNITMMGHEIDNIHHAQGDGEIDNIHAQGGGGEEENELLIMSAEDVELAVNLLYEEEEESDMYATEPPDNNIMMMGHEINNIQGQAVYSAGSYHHHHQQQHQYQPQQ